ncbi:3-dehydroquinate synthase II [Candidatus Nitrosocosmicus arcticus]|uniref:3-dehydroquinate synthase n=1 Tax=Candidatus Nitrosocosmicus arcticus TaxID=2035267 RepID=A0A557SYG8_9ARCH|nr:3-dehydroquinate synthase II [Candidatus Nitrosocosmicus arcticus]TVP41650.1 3-dehydroquinate synthase [Candidatus Nitrosocosmicus arcticus]
MVESNPRKAEEGKNKKKGKKIILKPLFYSNSDLSSVPKLGEKKNELAEFATLVNRIKDRIDLIYIDPSEELDGLDQDSIKIKTIFNSKDADYMVIESEQQLEEINLRNLTTASKIGIYRKVTSNRDIDQIKGLIDKFHLSFIIIDLDDWRIIPLENVIASLQNTGTEIFAVAKSIEEVETLFTVLELGVDGVLMSTNSEEEIIRARNIIKKASFQIKIAEIKEVLNVGMGERVCIDTVSMLSEGEGMLVGNKSNFLFLIHNESIGSSFTSPRPFRVNAGAVHCYTITPDGTTKYLSELESGSQVLIVNAKGDARMVGVGRAKIESRPLRLFRAAINDDEVGTIIVQNAETIRFLNESGKILPVTHAKAGDKILVYSIPSAGRHFGMEISKEYILEK